MWQTIDIFPDYEASKDGRVRSKSRERQFGKQIRTVPSQEIRPFNHSAGYLCVKLAKDIFLHLLNAGDRHDAVYWRRKDVECACFSQRTLCFLADSKSLAGRQTAIVRPAHDYFRLERI
jgi:hypothetical protein